MWEVRHDWLSESQLVRCRFTCGERTVTYDEVLTLWKDCGEFRTFFVACLADMPFGGFRWETPAVTRGTLNNPFEFIVNRADNLQRPVDTTAFAEHFANDHNSDVVSFTNLRRDATLVVPRPIAQVNCYGHLASFTRDAPIEQNHHLWQLVGRIVQEQIDDDPMWLNTAGMGVSWLHVRLDSRPKYYSFLPYKKNPTA